MDLNSSSFPNCEMNQSWTSQIINATEETVDPQLTDPLIQKLFRIFLVFTDELHSSGSSFGENQKVHIEEVRFLCALIGRELGFDLKFALEDPSQPQCSCEMIQRLPDYPNFLSFKELIESVGNVFPNRTLLEPAVKTVFEKIVNQVIKRGFSLKYNNLPLRKGWEVVWCVIIPGKLIYWPLSRDATTSTSKRRELILNKTCSSALAGYDKGKRLWEVYFGKKNRTFACFDQLEAQLWVSAVQLSIGRCESNENIYKPILSQLRKKRIFGESVAFDKSKSFTTEEQIRFEQKKLEQLEFDKKQLHESLELEKQAAKDEEIVRTLATRMLEEERIRREKLEQLHKDQEKLLTREQLRREQLELLARKREEEIGQLRQQLEQLTAVEKQAAAVPSQPPKTSSKDRREILKQLKSDQEALLQQQKDLREHVQRKTESYKEFVAETGDLLSKLMNNSHNRRISNSPVHSPTQKVIHTPNRSVSSESS